MSAQKTALNSLETLSARAIAKAIADKKISSVEATAEAITRLKAAHELTNCTVTLEADEALAAAKQADQATGPRGPLHGVPLAHKDMFDRTGKIASWGARIRADQPAVRDATVITRFKDAGSIQIAALLLTEFAFGVTGHNYVLGHGRNPWDPTRITGGSSTGTAAAVAYGAIPAGLGSDTAGSLRMPAALCGVASIKPTWGRVSRAGAMPLAPCLDTLGVIARHVEDLALMLGLLAGPDVRDPASSHVPVPDYLAALGTSVKGVRIGIDSQLIGAAHADIQKMLSDVVAALVSAGMVKADCTFPDWQRLDHMTQAIQLPDAASVHGAYMRTRPADYGPQVRARLEVGHFIAGIDHMTALRARGAVLQSVLDTTFKDIDVAILPIHPEPLPTIAELDVGGGPQMQATLARMLKYTRPVNYLGLPTLTLPAPRHGGRPGGVQIIAKPYAEAALFAIGHAYQQLVPPEIARPLA
jgi:aspartyl-tRNA(Asn)/glutamyl-tRNA(Gln) amidotransferase subunit A